ncbi:hypothetical protein [Aureimonas jatrophae]|uniref:Uncharacterized protein n=1 Tax=Aureimonas jatrophae TaxID=1166073 RepID=A0A1H0D3A8_9HYPH|nr:hypothetical protein [Aureimonas jatrophae]MBB3951686.1 hypothetical protein [Aureimonas jatrophae]SDN64608.1 hypothetical protein SAMN05192530_101578 [Aureimonas jatrophae]
MNKRELHDLIKDSVMADAMGLYEACWALPEGEIRDDDLRLRKVVSWGEVASAVLAMIEADEVGLVATAGGIATPVTGDVRQILEDKKNWRPFDQTHGTGYILTDKLRDGS